MRISSLGAFVGEDKIFDDLNFSSEDAHFVVVRGPNGAGKSTLLECLAGKREPDKGMIELNSKKTCYIPTETKYFVLPWYDTQKNVEIFTRKEFLASKMALELFLSNFELRTPIPLDRPAYLLSSGQRALLSVFLGQQIDPDVMLLDEIMANLSKENRQSLGDLLYRWSSKKGRLVLLVSHHFRLTNTTEYTGYKELVLH